MFLNGDSSGIEGIGKIISGIALFIVVGHIGIFIIEIVKNDNTNNN